MGVSFLSIGEGSSHNFAPASAHEAIPEAWGRAHLDRASYHMVQRVLPWYQWYVPSDVSFVHVRSAVRSDVCSNVSSSQASAGLL